MRMIVGGRGAHAHEFLGADLDHRHARIVVEMGDNVLRHGEPFCERFGGDFGRTIARRPRRVTVHKFHMSVELQHC